MRSSGKVSIMAGAEDIASETMSAKKSKSDQTALDHTITDSSTVDGGFRKSRISERGDMSVMSTSDSAGEATEIQSHSADDDSFKSTSSKFGDKKIPNKNIVLLKLTLQSQNLIGCTVGENLFVDKTWCLVNKQQILKDIEMFMTESAFFKYKNVIMEYPLDEFLIGYVPFGGKPDEFLFCLTQEGRNTVVRKLKALREEYMEKITNSKYVVPRPWQSLGSESEIADLYYHNTRPLMNLEWITKLSVRNTDLPQFSDLDAGSQRMTYNSIHFTGPQPELIHRMVNDSCTQTHDPKKTKETQTIPQIPTNKSVQCIPETELTEEAKSRSESFSPKQLDEFMKKYENYLLSQLHYNEVYDLYQDEYPKLLERGYNLQVPPPDDYKHYQSFTDVAAIEGKTIVATTWSTKYTGLVAVAYADEVPNKLKELESDSNDSEYEEEKSESERSVEGSETSEDESTKWVEAEQREKELEKSKMLPNEDDFAFRKACAKIKQLQLIRGVQEMEILDMKEQIPVKKHKKFNKNKISDKKMLMILKPGAAIIHTARRRFLKKKVEEAVRKKTKAMRLKSKMKKIDDLIKKERRDRILMMREKRIKMLMMSETEQWLDKHRKMYIGEAVKKEASKPTLRVGSKLRLKEKEMTALKRDERRKERMKKRLEEEIKKMFKMQKELKEKKKSVIRRVSDGEGVRELSKGREKETSEIKSDKEKDAERKDDEDDDGSERKILKDGSEKDERSKKEKKVEYDKIVGKGEKKDKSVKSKKEKKEKAVKDRSHKMTKEMKEEQKKKDAQDIERFSQMSKKQRDQLAKWIIYEIKLENMKIVCLNSKVGELHRKRWRTIGTIRREMKKTGKVRRNLRIFLDKTCERRLERKRVKMRYDMLVNMIRILKFKMRAVNTKQISKEKKNRVLEMLEKRLTRYMEKLKVVGRKMKRLGRGVAKFKIVRNILKRLKDKMEGMRLRKKKIGMIYGIIKSKLEEAYEEKKRLERELVVLKDVKVDKVVKQKVKRKSRDRDSKGKDKKMKIDKDESKKQKKESLPGKEGKNKNIKGKGEKGRKTDEQETDEKSKKEDKSDGKDEDKKKEGKKDKGKSESGKDKKPKKSKDKVKDAKKKATKGSDKKKKEMGKRMSKKKFAEDQKTGTKSKPGKEKKIRKMDKVCEEGRFKKPGRMVPPLILQQRKFPLKTIKRRYKYVVYKSILTELDRKKFHRKQAKESAENRKTSIFGMPQPPQKKQKKAKKQEFLMPEKKEKRRTDIELGIVKKVNRLTEFEVSRSRDMLRKRIFERGKTKEDVGKFKKVMIPVETTVDDETESLCTVWGENHNWVHDAKLRCAIRRMHIHHKRKRKSYRKIRSLLGPISWPRTQPSATRAVPKLGDVVTEYYDEVVDLEEVNEAAEELPTLDPNNPTLIWGFDDDLRPKLRLDCPFELTCIQFCPGNGNLLAGSTRSGQVVLWDLTGRLHTVENPKKLTPEEEKTRKILGDLMDWRKDIRSKRRVPITAISSRWGSHKDCATDLKWIHPCFKMMPDGTFKKIEENDRLTQQFVTTSTSGTIMFWDTDLSLIKPKAKKVRTVERPTTLDRFASPYEDLNHNWKPIFKLSLVRPETSLPRHCMCVSLDLPPTKYSRVTPEKPNVTEKLEDRIEYKAVYSAVEDFDYTCSVGTLAGNVGVITMEPSKRDPSSNTIPIIEEWHKLIHDGPITAIYKHPFIPELTLTSGGHIWAIWHSKYLEFPILWKRYRKVRITRGLWSALRPSLFRIARSDGNVEIWDLLRQSHKPQRDIVVSGQIVTDISGPVLPFSRGILSMGDYNSALRLFYIPWQYQVWTQEELEKLKIIIHREPERQIKMKEWRLWWCGKYGSKKKSELKEIHEMRKKEEEERLRQEEARRKYNEEVYKWYMRRRGKQFMFEELAEEKLMAKQKAHMLDVIMNMKKIDRKQMEKLVQPLVKTEKHERDREERARERLKEADELFNQAVIMIFPRSMEGETVNEENELDLLEDVYKIVEAKFGPEWASLKAEKLQEISDSDWYPKVLWPELFDKYLQYREMFNRPRVRRKKSTRWLRKKLLKQLIDEGNPVIIRKSRTELYEIKKRKLREKNLATLKERYGPYYTPDWDKDKRISRFLERQKLCSEPPRISEESGEEIDSSEGLKQLSMIADDEVKPLRSSEEKSILEVIASIMSIKKEDQVEGEGEEEWFEEEELDIDTALLVIEKQSGLLEVRPSPTGLSNMSWSISSRLSLSHFEHQIEIDTIPHAFVSQKVATQARPKTTVKTTLAVAVKPTDEGEVESERSVGNESVLERVDEDHVSAAGEEAVSATQPPRKVSETKVIEDSEDQQPEEREQSEQDDVDPAKVEPEERSKISISVREAKLDDEYRTDDVAIDDFGDDDVIKHVSGDKEMSKGSGEVLEGIDERLSEID